MLLNLLIAIWAFMNDDMGGILIKYKIIMIVIVLIGIIDDYGLFW